LKEGAPCPELGRCLGTAVDVDICIDTDAFTDASADAETHGVT
jgi:hypothetical protein